MSFENINKSIVMVFDVWEHLYQLRGNLHIVRASRKERGATTSQGDYLHNHLEHISSLNKIGS